jgi:hypothetical protein
LSPCRKYELLCKSFLLFGCGTHFMPGSCDNNQPQTSRLPIKKFISIMSRLLLCLDFNLIWKLKLREWFLCTALHGSWIMDHGSFALHCMDHGSWISQYSWMLLFRSGVLQITICNQAQPDVTDMINIIVL